MKENDKIQLRNILIEFIVDKTYLLKKNQCENKIRKEEIEKRINEAEKLLKILA